MEPEDVEPEEEDPVELGVPDGVDPVELDVPDVEDPAVDCVPEKSTAEVMPAAARLDSPTIEVTQTATRLPADRESMCNTSGVERTASLDGTTFGRHRQSTLSVSHHSSKTGRHRASRWRVASA